mmetsp:Transcript_113733/g.157389  ORF Transcript_113733/g.157389 Transcript_113733/m.157389 type:complete len:99 (+) Transcript_113733:1120-1416(+)
MALGGTYLYSSPLCCLVFCTSFSRAVWRGWVRAWAATQRQVAHGDGVAAVESGGQDCSPTCALLRNLSSVAFGCVASGPRYLPPACGAGQYFKLACWT